MTTALSKSTFTIPYHTISRQRTGLPVTGSDLPKVSMENLETRLQEWPAYHYWWQPTNKAKTLCPLLIPRITQVRNIYIYKGWLKIKYARWKFYVTWHQHRIYFILRFTEMFQNHFPHISTKRRSHIFILHKAISTKVKPHFRPANTSIF